MTAAYSVAVIGDINLDYIVNIPVKNISAQGDTVITAPIRQQLGGTAGSFARAATDYFQSVHVLGKLGNDAVGRVLRERLRSHGVTLHVITDPERASRVVLVLNFSNSNRATRRIMVGDDDTANFNVTVGDIAKWKRVLQTIDVLLVDAYSYLSEPRRTACAHAMQISLNAGAVTAFDIVPHDCYRSITLDDLRHHLTPAKLVISEVNTLAHFLELPPLTQKMTAAQIVNTMLPSLTNAFGDKVWFLRFGMGNIEQSIICMTQQAPVHSYTGYLQATERTGFGDVLTAQQLRWYLDKTSAPRIPGSAEDV